LGDQRPQRGGLALEAGTALGVGEQHAMALGEQPLHRLGEHAGAGGEGRLDQQVGPVAEAQRQQFLLAEARQPVHGDLGAPQELQLDALPREVPPQLSQRRPRDRRVHLVEPVQVRRGHERGGAGGERRAGQLERAGERLGTVVEAGKDVAVEVDHPPQR